MSDTENPFEPAAMSSLFFNVPQLPALFAALALAQAEYAPVVRDKLVIQKLKDKNTGAYTGGQIKFLYAELASILAATTPALSKNGLTFLQPLETAADGAIWVNSILAHKDGGMIISRMIVPAAKGMTELGGNITYIRRYAAGPALGVSAEDDADSTGDGSGGDEGGGSQEHGYGQASQPSARPQPARKSAAPAKTAAAAPARADGFVLPGQVKYLSQLVGSLKLTDVQLQAMLARHQVNGLNAEAQITPVQFEAIKAELEALRA